MSYNQKPPGPGGSGMGGGPPNGPNNSQQVAKTLAGIQQQMQNLVHGQNALPQTPPADLNAYLQQQRFQNMLKQQQQQLIQQHFQQQIHQQQQQQQQQQQSKERSGGTGGEPLALTRTPAAADLLNKTYQQHHQQQPNGSSASTPALNQFQQQLQAISPNIMLQAFQYQMQQHQQQQQQHHPQVQQTQHHTQQAPPQPQAPLTAPHQQQQQMHGQTHQQQQKALSTAAAAVQQFQQNFQQRYLSAAAAVSAQSAVQVTSGNKRSVTPPPPPLTNQMKPPNLPPSTQITPVPANAGGSTAGSVGKNPTTSLVSGTATSKQVLPSISLLPAKQTATSPTPAAAHQQNKFGTGKASPVVSAIPPPFPSHFQKPSTVSGTNAACVANPSKIGTTPEAAAVNKLPQTNPMPLTKQIVASDGIAIGKLTQITDGCPNQTTIIPNTNQTLSQKAAATPPIPAVASIVKNPKVAQVIDISGNNKSDEGTIASNPKPGVSPIPSVKEVKTSASSIGNKAIETVAKIVDTGSKEHTAIGAPHNNIPAKPSLLQDTISLIGGEKSSTKVSAAVEAPEIDTNKNNTPSMPAAPAKEGSKVVENPKTNPSIEVSENKINATKFSEKLAHTEKASTAIEFKREDVPLESEKKNDIAKTVETSLKTAEQKVEKNEMENIVEGIEEKKKLVSDNQIIGADTLAKLCALPDECPTKAKLENEIAETKEFCVLEGKTNNSEVTVKAGENKKEIYKEQEIINLDSSPEKTKEENSRNTKVEKAETKITISLSTVSKESTPATTKAKASNIETPANSGSTQSKKHARQSKSARSATSTSTPAIEKEKPAEKNEKTPGSSRTSREEKRKSKVGTFSPDCSYSPATPKEAHTSSSSNDRKSQRHRLKTILYQSPLPELAFITKLSASEASNSPKPMSGDDKLIVFYKSEYMAVRNAEGTFYLCQTLQNVYRTSPRISIRWLSEDSKDIGVYIPDFYDHTDIECVLTTVELKRVDKGHLRLPNTEKARIENILKKAIDVEKGLLPRPELTEENPDGLDISLYKDESQIEKKTPSGGTSSNGGRKSRRNPNTATSKSANMIPTTSRNNRKRSTGAAAEGSARKSPTKKRKSLTKRKRSSKCSTSSDDSSDDSESDAEYKPNQKKSTNTSGSKSSPRAQRSPLAKARAASPMTPTSSRNNTVPQKITSTTAFSSRSERATKRKAATTADAASESATPAKKVESITPTITTNTSKLTIFKIKTQENADDVPIKKLANETSAVPSAASSLASNSPSGGAAAYTTANSSTGSNRPTRSRK